MKTREEAAWFIGEWSLSKEDYSEIMAYIDSLSSNSPKIPGSDFLKSVFLRWYNDDYVPSRFDRIHYTNSYGSCVGIVKNHSPRTGEIVLYCSFDYSTRKINTSPTSIHTGYIIRPCTESEYKRLKSELNKIGMVWKDKLHRLEPINVKPSVGSTYWYLDDKLEVRTDIEKNGKQSHMRYIAGNYFTDYSKALEVCDKVREILKESIADL